MSAEPVTELVAVGDVELAVTQAGEGPAVVLVHGFPELAHSWRHQIRALADAGFRVIAADQRGLGGSSAPGSVEACDVVELAGDVIGLLDAFGIDRAAVVGHDWGADVAWKTALMHPERISRVAGLSVPYVPRAPAPPVGIMREHLGEDFYIVWMQEPGVADAALARDVRRSITTTRVWNAAWAADNTEDPPTPPWMSEEDVAVYVEAYTRTGFTPGLNWYRNLDRNWERLAAFDGRTIDQPALFIVGTRDPVLAFMPPEAMTGSVTDLRVERIEGAGHWVQQERPQEVSALLAGFLAGA